MTEIVRESRVVFKHLETHFEVVRPYAEYGDEAVDSTLATAQRIDYAGVVGMAVRCAVVPDEAGPICVVTDRALC